MKTTFAIMCINGLLDKKEIAWAVSVKTKKGHNNKESN